jgi:hypothetical protein
MAGGAETPNIAALPAIARLGTCESARGPDADRHVKLLSQFAVEGSLSGAYSQLDARIRGRLLFRLSIYQTFHPESDHSDGMFVFAGWTFFFEIHDEQDGLVLIIGMHEQ